MPNPLSYTFAIVALSAALFLYILAAAFSIVWRARCKMLVARMGGHPAHAGAPIPAQPAAGSAPKTSALDPMFGGICAARATEALAEQIPDGLQVKCPAHGTPIGQPCLAESDVPVDAKWASMAADTIDELEKLKNGDPSIEALPPPGPPRPCTIVVGQIRAKSEAPDAKRCEIVQHDPTRREPWLARLVPDEGTDEATIAATAEARSKWAGQDELEDFWPVIVAPSVPNATAARALIVDELSALPIYGGMEPNMKPTFINGIAVYRLVDGFRLPDCAIGSGPYCTTDIATAARILAGVASAQQAPAS